MFFIHSDILIRLQDNIIIDAPVIIFLKDRILTKYTKSKQIYCKTSFWWKPVNNMQFCFSIKVIDHDEMII